jgi:hypothetical protein
MGFTIKDGFNAAMDTTVGRGIKSGIDALDKATQGPRTQFNASNSNRFNRNKYKIDQHSYPSDLMSETYGGNYAIFYINVSDDSKLNVSDNTVELDPSTEARMRGSLVAKNMSKGTLIGAQAGVTILEGALGGLKKDGKAGAVKGAQEAKGEAAVGAIGVALAASLAPSASRSQRRLKTAIALHIPNQLSVRYGTQWTENDTAAIQAVADAGGNLAEGLAAADTKKLSTVAPTVREAGAGLALSKIPNAGAVSSALGIAANPKKEQTFQGVDFREFSFDYQFFPRNEFEAQNVLNIIHQFKLHMHPEFKSELNYVWIYPSEFDISYYTGGMENLNLHKHTSCVLKSMNVNYTPNGNFAVFANGMPTQINMTLEFKELQLASKETIGFTPGGL